MIIIYNKMLRYIRPEECVKFQRPCDRFNCLRRDACCSGHLEFSRVGLSWWCLSSYLPSYSIIHYFKWDRPNGKSMSLLL